MVTRRQRRVSALIREAISELLQKEISDPRLDFVTVTYVETTSDLRQAHIYVTFLGDSKDLEESLGALRKAAGYLRRQLGQKVYLRYVPELNFHLDRSVEQGLRIDRILQGLENSQKQSEE
ncbi:MAG: ribosome-binding factor A [Chloroflexi bacterium B3_Chlor]|nr:MAG: ribosome-binding factor A [Chloroflexi bacterium B3_Chlor]